MRKQACVSVFEITRLTVGKADVLGKKSACMCFLAPSDLFLFSSSDADGEAYSCCAEVPLFSSVTFFFYVLSLSLSCPLSCSVFPLLSSHVPSLSLVCEATVRSSPMRACVCHRTDDQERVAGMIALLAGSDRAIVAPLLLSASPCFVVSVCLPVPVAAALPLLAEGFAHKHHLISVT